MVRTVPAAEAPVRLSWDDYDPAWNRAPVDAHGNRVDHRTGLPMEPDRWRVAWDPAGGRWMAESPDALPVPRSNVPVAEVLADYPRPQVARTVTVTAGQVPGPQTPLVRFDPSTGVHTLFDEQRLAGDACYDVAGRGRFYTDADGAVVRVETTSGGGAGLNPDLQHPLPDVQYVVNSNTVFTTDHLARTTMMDARGLVTVHDGPRSGHTQRLVGAEGRAEYPGADYQGGHLRGAQFDGPTERINYVPMLEEINNAQSSLIDPVSGRNFGTLENELADVVRRNPDAVVDLRVIPVFEGENRVPVMIRAQYRVDGGRWIEEPFENVR